MYHTISHIHDDATLQCFLLLKVSLKRKGRQWRSHSRLRKAFWRSLLVEEHCHCCRHIPWLSLLSLPESPQQKLFASLVNQAFITMTGFDHNAFTTLLQKNALAFDDSTPFNKQLIELKEDPKREGQPRMMWPKDCPGLVLVWTWTQGSMTALQLIFCLLYANLCIYL